MNSIISDLQAKQSPKVQSSVPRRDVARYEFIEGTLVAKPAADRWHNLIATNFVVAIGSRIHKGSCEVYAGSMQVRTGGNSMCFPDVVVVSGEPSFTDNGTVLLNPTIMVEIFSSATKSSSHTQKLEGFLAVPDIKEFLLVNENEMRIEHYSKQNAKTWMYRIYDERDDMINMESIGCKMVLAEVYGQIKFGTELSAKAAH